MKQAEKSFRDAVFKQRCIRCKGFVFLIHTEKVNEKMIEGVITCPDCQKKYGTLLFKQASQLRCFFSMCVRLPSLYERLGVY